MKVLEFNKREWMRMSDNALELGHRNLALDYYRYSKMSTMPVQMFDSVQTVYRVWLNNGFKK